MPPWSTSSGCEYRYKEVEVIKRMEVNLIFGLQLYIDKCSRNYNESLLYYHTPAFECLIFGSWVLMILFELTLQLISMNTIFFILKIRSKQRGTCSIVIDAMKSNEQMAAEVSSGRRQQIALSKKQKHTIELLFSKYWNMLIHLFRS